MTTANYDPQRTNATLSETTLTPANVHPSRFGRLFSRPVDGYIYAQPLYTENVLTAAGPRNLVFVATKHNSVYAFDADDPTADEPLWQARLGTPLPTTVWPGFIDILPEVGILSTPVIDRAASLLYAVACTREAGTTVYRLHALDLRTGAEALGGPVVIEAVVDGTAPDGRGRQLAFDPNQHLQRSGLALAGGRVIVSFGSHADQSPFHGWVMAYDAQTLAQVAVLCTTPNSGEGAVWQGGRAPALDDAGNLYLTTGNGTYDGRREFGSSVLRLDLARGLAVEDHFTPSDWQDLNDSDLDLGSSGPVLVPGTSLLVVADKSGKIHLLDRNRLGGLQPDDLGQLQELQAARYGLFNLVVWPRPSGALLYARGTADPLRSWLLDGNRLRTLPASSSTVRSPYGFDGMALSANGQTPGTGILWQTAADEVNHPARGVLRAYDALDLSRELWSSEMEPQRDRLGAFAKFATPTVANGKVYVPTFSNQLAVYGLLPPPRPGLRTVLNAASGQPGPFTSGLLVRLHGAGLGPEPGVSVAPVQGVFPTLAAGTRVRVNGLPAPLLFVSDAQVSAVLPAGLPSEGVAELVVERDGIELDRRSLPLAASAPGLFTLDGSGTGVVAAQKPDGSSASYENPVEPDSEVTLFATGFGISPEQDGRVNAPDAPIVADLEVVVLVNDQPTEVLSVRPAPGQVAGLYAVGIRLPSVPSGAYSTVTLRVNGVSAQTNTVVYGW